MLIFEESNIVYLEINFIMLAFIVRYKRYKIKSLLNISVLLSIALFNNAHAHIHTHTHTYIYTHTHTHIKKLPKSPIPESDHIVGPGSY